LLEQDDENVKIFISDNGAGIPDNYKDKIFESNFTTKEKGMGLGLKLAKRFIENSKGSIELIGSSGHGTKFLITIPLLSFGTGKTG
jgi:two-component system nitrogen regulation sensor histidine kinase NtrY